MFDIFELPQKYTFNNKESLLDGVYIDDNSLFTYFCISKGIFDCDKDSQKNFIFFPPFEWTSIDYIAFLLFVSKERRLIIENIRTSFFVFEEEYEISNKPGLYKGANKWILELKEKEPSREEAILFDKFFTDTASASDLERLLIYADRIAFKDTKNREPSLSKEIFRKMLDHTSFSINLISAQKNKLENDIDSYLDAFINNKLVRNSQTKRIGNTKVEQSLNIFTFKKHSALLRDYLHKMQEDFGNTLTIENTFEERFPNLEYPDTDVIRNRYSNRNFFFVHTLLTFQKQGLIKILRLSSNWDFHEDKMLTYQAKIEILPAFFNEDVLKKLHFDEGKSRFYVQGNEIELKIFGNEYYALRIIFKDSKDIGKEWFFTEIAEQIDENNINIKRYSNALYQLKLKLAKVGINDFFNTNKHSFNINPKYLT